MRSPLLVILLASVTPAAASPVQTQLDLEQLPEACRELGELANSSIKNQALSARISLASCLVDERAKRLVLCDCEQSVIDINAAIDPSLALLDEVFVLGDPATQILARHTQGEILAGFAQRMLATVPPAMSGSPEAIALRDMRLDLLYPMIEPWQVRAQAAFKELDQIARANPKLAKNPAVLAAVRATRAKLGQGTQAAKR